MSITDSLIEQVYKTCHDYQLLDKGSRVLIAVSGGADSVCLLHILVSLQDRLQVELGVAHLNHGFRGEESDSEELFTQKLALRLGLPYYSAKKELLEIVDKECGSTQMVAREVRYGFLKQVALDNGYDKIALAHNRDDRVETFFLKALNGSSPAALASIPFSRGQFIRPLQEINRLEIIKFLRQVNEDFVTDSSNLSNKYQRNFIRNKIFPLLEDKFGDFKKRVIRLSETIQEENVFWKDMFSQQKSWGMFLKTDEVSFDLEMMRLAPIPLVKRIISEYSALISEGLTLPPTPFYDQLASFLAKSNKNRIWFEGKNLIIKTLDNRVLMRRHAINQVINQFNQLLSLGENYLPNGVIVSLKVTEPPNRDIKFFKQDAKKGIFWVSYKDIGLKKLTVRSRENGDYIYIAESKRKKIKDILIDDKISKEKCSIFIVDNRGKQVALLVSPCYLKSRISYSYLSLDADKKLLRLQIKMRGEYHE